MLLYSEKWRDYELLDTGNGERLERWDKFVLRRPDPQVIWPRSNNKLWEKVDAHYHRSSKGGGKWEYLNKIPESWNITYRNLRFKIRTTGFKHTGLFPEQAANWDWMGDKIRKTDKKVNVLNLFAYTGGATLACAEAGASVCHVDAAKSMVSWARENLELSGLGEKSVRWIVDDTIKFVQRETRRNKKYEGIIMDPPSYGHGPNQEIWHLEDKLYELVSACLPILAAKPLFFLLNSYTTGCAPTVLGNIVKLALGKKLSGQVSSQEVGLVIKSSGLILPCGSSARWEA